MDPFKENNGFGPLSRKRGRNATYVSLSLLGSFVLFIMAISCNLQFWAFSFALSYLALFLGEVTRRLCLLTEEITHRTSRYRGSLKAVLKRTFSFQNDKIVAMCVIISLTIVGHYVLTEFSFSSNTSEYMALFFINISVVPLSLYITGLRESSPIEISELNERENKNVADGLAWCYYYGYLKIILPHLEKQINSSEKYRYLINVPKVFVLLPRTCLFPANGRIPDTNDRITQDGPLS